MRIFKKTAKFLLIFLLMMGWIFSGWPRIWQNPPFPPDVERAQAATNDATIEVLGGGGGGGFISGSGGGGGGGGEYHRCTETLTVQSYTVTVGVGGTIDTTGETDSVFSGTGISMTADGGNGSANASAGTAGTGGTVTGCDVGPTTYAGGTPGAGNTADYGGGAGGGAGYGGKGGDGVAAISGRGGGGGGGAGESGAGGNASAATGGTAGSGGGGAGGTAGTGETNGSKGGDGTPVTYHIVGGGGGGGSGGPTNRVGGACSTPGAGSGGGEVTGAGNGCRGEVRIIYVDSEINATGGTETTSGIYRIHTFTTSGTFTVSLTLPTVTTQAASSVEATTATGNGNITSTGGENVTKRGFVYDTSSKSLPGNVAPTASGYASYAEDTGTYGTGAFTKGLTSLNSGITYYARAYAYNSLGYSYGGEVNFLTKPGAPAIGDFTNVQQTTLTVNWTAATGATSYKVERCANSECTPLEVYSGVTDLFKNDSGLTASTLYRYRIRATNATGDGAYSGTGETTTQAAVVYSVTVDYNGYPDPVGYGGMPINTTKASVTITATVGNAATKLNIIGADATYNIGGEGCGGDGVCTWTLSAVLGEDQYVHAFTKNTGLATGGELGTNPESNSKWVALTKTEQLLVASVTAYGSQTFKLDMRTPSSEGTETNLGSQYSTDVTIVASAP